MATRYLCVFRNNQQVVEEAFMVTLNTLFHAPATSPLASVDVNNVAELLVQLTDASQLIRKTPAAATASQVRHNIALLQAPVHTIM